MRPTTYFGSTLEKVIELRSLQTTQDLPVDQAASNYSFVELASQKYCDSLGQVGDGRFEWAVASQEVVGVYHIRIYIDLVDFSSGDISEMNMPYMIYLDLL